MVKKLAVFFAYLIFFISALLYFTPKVSLYYFLEEQLKKEGVIISSEEIVDNGFTLSITDADISVKSINSASITHTYIGIFFIYNYIKLQDIKLSSALKSFIPLHLDSVDISYSVFNPLNIELHGVGEFGKIDGSFDITKMFMHLSLKPSKLMIKNNANTLRNFKKDANGEFSYDKTF